MGAAALYTDGVLSHVPRVTSGVHACCDCGQLDMDALLEGRADTHASAESPHCGMHRREVVSGQRYRQNVSPPVRATPQLAGPRRTVGSATTALGTLPHLREDEATAMVDVQVADTPAADRDVRARSPVPLGGVAHLRPNLGSTSNPSAGGQEKRPPAGRQVGGGWKAWMSRGRSSTLVHGSRQINHVANQASTPASAFP